MPDLFFLPQKKGNGAMLFSIQETSSGPELSKIGTFDTPEEPRLIAAALNAALQGQANALAKVHQCAASLPGPLKKAVIERAEDIEKALRSGGGSAETARKAARALTETLGRPNLAMLSFFSTTACGDCVECGCAVDEDCAKCLICGPDGHGCGECGPVGMTPRNAFVLHHVLRDLSDRTYFTARSSFWEYSLPDSVETQTDWFLLHCARAYDDLASDLLTGQIPEPRCLAESVALGFALRNIGGLRTESIRADESYRALPASRFDDDWDFLPDAMAFDVGDRAREFLTSDVIEEDLWDEWFQPYPGVEPRDQDRGFRR
ncbi:hypothetical protein [Streptomyces capitiformicae]|uniref:Uncharacterized protein n=1 Tax=Streptomyces capitiformicae TaxID=2014920 RepID=A0A919GBE5_9ACTN|nr:hypothetical protein [Streptomyces capitiformicae]GHH81682.1 hypothetical protein GCM10017771_04210 [Streptomyces capitiformicae]